MKAATTVVVDWPGAWNAEARGGRVLGGGGTPKRGQPHLLRATGAAQQGNMQEAQAACAACVGGARSGDWHVCEGEGAKGPPAGIRRDWLAAYLSRRRSAAGPLVTFLMFWSVMCSWQCSRWYLLSFSDTSDCGAERGSTESWLAETMQGQGQG